MNISLSGASDPQRLIASEVELNWSMVATSLNRGQFPPTRAVYPLKIRLRSSGNGKREPFEQHLTTRRKLVRRKRRISNVRHAHVITAGTLRTSKRPSLERPHDTLVVQKRLCTHVGNRASTSFERTKDAAMGHGHMPSVQQVRRALPCSTSPNLPSSNALVGMEDVVGEHVHEDALIDSRLHGFRREELRATLPNFREHASTTGIRPRLAHRIPFSKRFRSHLQEAFVIRSKHPYIDIVVPRNEPSVPNGAQKRAALQEVRYALRSAYRIDVAEDANSASCSFLSTSCSYCTAFAPSLAFYWVSARSR